MDGFLKEKQNLSTDRALQLRPNYYNALFQQGTHQAQLNQRNVL
ncbi:hypothetical protein [Leptothermofonsia sp. ETS-13]